MDASEDTIVNSEEESGAKAELHTTSTKERQTQVQIQLAKAAEEEKKIADSGFKKRSSMRDQKRCS